MRRFFLVMFIFITVTGCSAEQQRDVASSIEATQPETVSADQKRVALVVGNSAYLDAGLWLKNPSNDAKEIATSLRMMGVEVIEATDLDQQGMREALRRFDRALQDADAGLFYYAGHGMEYRGRNYLFPTDSVLETEGDVQLGLIDVDQVLRMMETAVPTRLVFLDACRNNPLARRFRSTLGASRTASVGRGLGRMDAAVGTFIAYATSPGELAADGKGDHSPFTAAMLTHLDEPGLDVSQLMHRVRNSVIELTNEKQIPWESSSLRGPFILNLDVTIDHVSIEAPITVPADATPAKASVNGAYAKAVELYRRSCDQGDIGDCINLGSQYQLGRGVEQNYAKALELFEGACDRGLVRGCANVGVLYDNGFGVEQDHAKSFALYKQACDGGHARSCKNLGSQYKYGRGVEQDHATANEFFTKACDGGNALGCTLLGDQFAEGSAVEQDDARAIELYKESCGSGESRGCTELGDRYSKGDGVQQNGARAIEFYHQGCDGGDADGCDSLGHFYSKGAIVEQDHARAKELYRKACDGGSAGGCESLGDFETNN